MTLGERFDPRANGLNLIRLLFATSVIVWHAFPQSNRDVDSGALRQLMENGPVDGFFAISGFLIAGSWMRRPKIAPFLTARVLRIFPGFLVCLVVTAGILAPVGLLLSGEGLPSNYLSGGIGYVVKNASLNMLQYDIAGTPTDVPYPHVWDGSLWTLRWEFLCYLGILAIGIIGVLRRQWIVVAIYMGAVLALIGVVYGPLDGDTITDFTRLSVMFLAGTLVYLFQTRLPGRLIWSLPAAAIVGASLFMHGYQIVAAPFLAYLLINIGGHITSPRLRFKNDISYGIYIYGWPVAQILAGVGMTDGPIVLFMLATIAITIPLAAASWFVVEKPVMKLRHIRRPSTLQEAALVDRA